jgi:hypothetical protein
MVDLRTREGRALRETKTREAETRDTAWRQDSLLPDPTPVDGIRYRWIRTAVRGQGDVMNVSVRMREGWVPVKREEVPEMAGVMTDFNSKFPENVEIGGLLLCRIDEETAARRQKQTEEKARDQIRASDHNFMREADPRMPLLKPERSSRTTFGGGSAPR